jgi:hypothetical protein
MLHVSNEGTSERMRETSTQDNSTLTWRMTERVEGTTNPARREAEVVSSEDYMVMAGPQQTEGKPLILLQVNCRSILSKILEFWKIWLTHIIWM